MPNRCDMGGLLDARSRDTAEQSHAIRQMGTYNAVRGFVPSGLGGVSSPPSRTKQNATFHRCFSGSFVDFIFITLVGLTNG